MALTSAEKQKRYRERHKATKVASDSAESNDDGRIRNDSVTSPGVTSAIQGCEGGKSGVAPPRSTDLPKDVIREIEKHCSENNNGERAGSHSRQAMTERAMNFPEVVEAHAHEFR